jgi:hypothetical protein
MCIFKQIYINLKQLQLPSIRGADNVSKIHKNLKLTVFLDIKGVKIETYFKNPK